ncbi:MAG: phosphodiesterase [Pseudomonadota bacterium]
MKFAVLTDTHLLRDGKTLFTINPGERLRQAFTSINRDHPDISFIIITGDLAHLGEPAAYENLHDAIALAHVPVKLMMGNHDRRRYFRNVFADRYVSNGGFVQWQETFTAFSLIVLDTLNEDSETHAGLLCRERLSFLHTALAAAPADRPLLLFQHHPPFSIGLPSMDKIKLQNGEEEWQLISSVRKPDYIFMGHIHRPVSGIWHGIPYHIQRGLAHQVDLDFKAVKIPGTLEEPDYSIVTVETDTLTIHQKSFAYSGPRFWLEDRQAQAAHNTNELRR